MEINFFKTNNLIAGNIHLTQDFYQEWYWSSKILIVSCPMASKSPTVKHTYSRMSIAHMYM